MTVTATDGSLTSPQRWRSGVTSLTVTVDGQSIPGGSAAQSCTRPQGSCALTVNAMLPASQLEQLGAGDHQVVVKATDALGQPGEVQWSFEYDPAPPTLALAGKLADYDGEVLTEDGYELDAEALDADAETYGSGLRDIVIRLDGQSVPTAAISCISPCESGRRFSWNTTTATNGPHVIEITAADNVGNQATERVEVDLAREPDEPPRALSAPARTVTGAQAGDRAGASVAVLGDIDLDGRTDYLIGAPGAGLADLRVNAGAAYIVRGGDGNVDLAVRDGRAARILGAGANQYCGASVASVGDVNGDGLDDMLIGCPGLDPRVGGVTATGRVFVVFGSTSSQDIDLANLGSRGFEIVGPPSNLPVGSPLSTRGAVFGERLQSVPQGMSAVTQDVDGDDLADIVIGDSTQKQGGLDNAGAAYVIFGKTDAAAVNVAALGAGGFVIRGYQANSLSGYASAIVGDVDGDTLADVAVGAPTTSATQQAAGYLVSGADSTADVTLSSGGERVLRVTSPAGGDRFGASVAAVGDTDIDGRDDWAIGTSSGAYVVRARLGASRQLTTGDGYAVTGPSNTALLGTQVPAAPIAAVGDINGDGRSDLAVGYPDVASPSRAAVVFSPERSRTLSVSALPGQRGTGLSPGDQPSRTGAAIAAHPDRSDETTTEAGGAIVGAPEATSSLLRPSAGSAYVLADVAASGNAAPSAGLRTAAGAQASAARRSLPRGCYRSRTKPYRFGVGPGFPFGFTAAAVTGTAPNLMSDYDSDNLLPTCRATVNTKPDQVPMGFSKNTADYAPRPFSGPAVVTNGMTRVSWSITDSFNRRFGTLRQIVKVRKGKRIVQAYEVLDRGGDEVNKVSVAKTELKVQGYACYVGSGGRRSVAMIALRPQNGTDGIRGFIDKDAIKRNVSDARLEQGDTECQSSRGLAISEKAAIARSGLDGDPFGHTGVSMLVP